MEDILQDEISTWRREFQGTDALDVGVSGDTLDEA